MKIRDLLDINSIELNGESSSKEYTIKQMVLLMSKQGNIKNIGVYEKGVLLREEEGTTGVGNGIAIPHCKSEVVKKPGLAAMVVPQGVDFGALDNEPVKLIFLIAAPDTEDNIHLDVLSKLSRMLMNNEFVESLKNAKSREEFLNIIDVYEAEIDRKESREKGNHVGAYTTYEVLTVTSCPNGIAHTYMAAEAFIKAGEKIGVNVKAETRGSSGTKQLLTEDEIKNAKGIIVAADTKVPMDRFDGKPVIEVSVGEGIHKAEELICMAAKGDAPIYKANTKNSSQTLPSKNNSIYTHLMSGVSHMLPFVIGGGILIALAFLVDTVTGHANVGGSFGSATPLSAFFKYIGGLSMGLMVPVLAGYIAYSIADRPGLSVGFAGGLIASSGNALAANYDWKNLGAFGTFIKNFAFQGEHGGNTVSGFLGGILVGFLAGYIVLYLKYITRNMPKSLEGLKPMLIYPIGGLLITSILMCVIFNPLIGMINTGLYSMLNSLAATGMIAILGFVLGAMMAIDMGGPINKAAYVFGTGMLAEAGKMIEKGTSMTDPKIQACYIAMAAVMVGGMVPPLGIALACKFFPKRFTKEERQTWVSNIVMGSSFITEGAIPFAASDPTHVIPATMLGAGVAGLLSAMFKCTLMAPHGGVFVFITIGNPFMYIVSWLVGSIITMILLGILKKDVE